MKSKAMKIISKVILGIIGVFLIISPGTALEKLIKFIGFALLAVGIIGIITFITTQNKGLLAGLVFFASVVLILLSILPLTKPAFVAGIFPFAVGVLLAGHGVVNIIEALSLRRTNAPWKLPMTLSIISVIAGGVIAFYPFSAISLLVRIVGIVAVYNAAVGLWIAIKSQPVTISENGVVDITEMN